MEKNHRKHTYKDYFKHRNKTEFRDAVQLFHSFFPKQFPIYIFNGPPPALFPQFNKERGM